MVHLKNKNKKDKKQGCIGKGGCKYGDVTSKKFNNNNNIKKRPLTGS